MQKAETTAADDQSTAALARYLQVLAHPVRLRLVRLLAEGEASVAELVDGLGMPRSRVSNHLACLRWCGLAVSERRGRTVVYRLADPRLPALIELVTELSAEQADHLANCTSIGPGWI